jgi:hypothetical protein
MITKVFKNVPIIMDEILKNAGLENGLDCEDIKSELKTLFWYAFVKNSDASKKETYLVWNYQSITSQYGDGKTLVHPVRLVIAYYSKEPLVSEELEKIETEFKNKKFSFSFSKSGYNPELEMYSYEFFIEAMENNE